MNNVNIYSKVWVFDISYFTRRPLTPFFSTFVNKVMKRRNNSEILDIFLLIFFPFRIEQNNKILMYAHHKILSVKNNPVIDIKT